MTRRSLYRRQEGVLNVWSAQDHAEHAMQWRRENGLFLRVLNDGQHWQVKRRNMLLVQWWPSTSKLVYGIDYRSWERCDDVMELLDVVAQILDRFREPSIHGETYWS